MVSSKRPSLVNYHNENEGEREKAGDGQSGTGVARDSREKVGEKKSREREEG